MAAWTVVPRAHFAVCEAGDRGSCRPGFACARAHRICRRQPRVIVATPDLEFGRSESPCPASVPRSASGTFTTGARLRGYCSHAAPTGARSGPRRDGVGLLDERYWGTPRPFAAQRTTATGFSTADQQFEVDGACTSSDCRCTSRRRARVDMSFVPARQSVIRRSTPGCRLRRVRTDPRSSGPLPSTTSADQVPTSVG
jgi:hypothetical protein